MVVEQADTSAVLGMGESEGCAADLGSEQHLLGAPDLAGESAEPCVVDISVVGEVAA